MKTILYGTTAMIAAVAVVGTASAQAAKKPNEKITLQLGGYFEANYVFGDESQGQRTCPIRNVATGVTAGCTDPIAGGPAVPFGGNVNEPARGRRFQRVNREAEIYFRGQTTLDNGLTVGAFVQMEAETSADLIDESYIYFSGSFGRVEYGSMDSVAEQMYYGAPAAIQGMSTIVNNTKQHQTGGNSQSTVNVGPSFSGYADWEKVNYYTPRIAGFQFGISYAPDTCEEQNGTFAVGGSGLGGAGGLGPTGAVTGGLGVNPGQVGTVACTGSYGGFTTATNSGQQGDVAVLGANFVRKFGPVDFNAMAFYQKGHLEGATGAGTANGTLLTDRKNIGFGMNVAYMGFTLGGGWNHDNLGVRSNNTDRSAFNVGLRYRTGPWQFGVEYGRAEQGQGIAGAGVPAAAGTRAGDDSLENFNVGIDYTMGPGIRFYGGLQYFNVDDNFGNPANENNGVIVVLGTRLDF